MTSSKKKKAAKRLFHWIKGYIGTCLGIYLVLASIGAFAQMSLSVYNPMEWHEVSRFVMGVLWALLLFWGIGNYHDLTKDVK